MQKRMSDILFCTEFNFWANCESHLTSCDGARVFWENEKIQWKNPFLVASALVSLLVSIVSDSNSETCYEIAKVTFWRKSGFGISIRARERLHFQIQDFAFFAPVCPCSSTYTCTLLPLTHIGVGHLLYLFPFLTFLFCFYFFFFPFVMSMVCVCLSLYLYSMTKQRSWWPRKLVTRQLWSSCWKRGLTRRLRIRLEKKMKENHTHTHLKKMWEWRRKGSTIASSHHGCCILHVPWGAVLVAFC